MNDVSYPYPAGVTPNLPGELFPDDVADAYDFFNEQGYDSNDFSAVASSDEGKKHISTIGREAAERQFWMANEEIPF